MDSYKCPACAGEVSQAAGCTNCGRAWDAELAALAMFQRTVASLEAKQRQLVRDRLLLREQLAHTSAQRDSLLRKIRQRVEGAGGTQPRMLRSKVIRRAGKASTGSLPDGLDGDPLSLVKSGVSGTGAAQITGAAADLGASRGTPGTSAPYGAPPPGPSLGPPPGPPLGAPPGVATVPAGSRPPVHGTGRIGGAETTTRSTQTVLLSLGGLLLGGAAVVLTVVAIATIGAVGRGVLLSLSTPLILGLPVWLARRRLVATAETLAGVGLLLVLLDGYVAWSQGLFGARVIPTSIYFGVVFAVTALIATGYRRVTHLVAPGFARVLVLQAVLPFLANEWISGPAGWSLVFVGVAVQDLAMAIWAGRSAPATPTAVIDKPVADADAAEPTPPSPASMLDRLLGDATAVLREATWILFVLAFGIAFAFATYALAITGDSLAMAVRAAAVLLLATGVGLAGALAWARQSIVDLAGGLTTVAVVIAVTRVGSVALPEYTLLFAALSVALAALVVPLLPATARRGPQTASGVTAAVVGALVLGRALSAIAAPILAVRPIWHTDLARYDKLLADAAGTAGWQFVVAGILITIACAVAVPDRFRTDSALTGCGFTVLVAPAALHLNWVAAPAVLVTIAIIYGGAAITSKRPRTVYGCLISAGVVGLDAAAVSLTRPGATALTLTAITFAGTIIAAPRPSRSDPAAEALSQLVAEVAAGAATFALPGAVATGLAALIAEQVVPNGRATGILAGTFLAVCGTLGYTAITQVAQRRISPPLLLGTTLGAAAVAIASVVADGRTITDLGIGLLLFTSAILLWLAPTLAPRRLFGQDLDGDDAAAAAVTASVILALSRVVYLASPHAGVVTTAALVLATALAIWAMPRAWGRGPIAGASLVGVLVAVAAGVGAIGAGVGVIQAAGPAWNADLGPAWLETASQYALLGWQAPAALLLIAVAAAVAMPRPYGNDVAASALGLATIGAPVGLKLAWWSPMLLGFITASALGLAAVGARTPRNAYSRLIVAGIVALYATGASLVRAPATAGTLASMALAATAIAAVAGLRLAFARLTGARSQLAYLVPVGGAAAGVAVLAFAGASAASAGGLHRPPTVILSGTLATVSVALVVAVGLCWRLPGFLPYVTAGASVAGTATAVASLVTVHPQTGVYAAAAALLGVLAELLRTAARQSFAGRARKGPARNDAVPASGRHGVTLGGAVGRGVALGGAVGRGVALGGAVGRGVALRSWRQVRAGDFGFGVAAASGLSAAIAIVVVGPAVFAALVAPFTWITRPWTGTPETAADFGKFSELTGTGSDVVAAAALTLASALAAVGLSGRAQEIAGRAVAVVVPGAAMTLLIAPAALRWPDPLQATFALLVATLAGLGLALTRPAPATSDGARMRTARRLVFSIAVLAAAAGQAGSLATRSMTIQAWAGSVVVGLIAAIWGRYGLARFVGWQVAIGALEILALVVALAAGAPAHWAAYPLLASSAVGLALAAALPRFRLTSTIRYEVMVIEATAYLGAVGALILTFGAPRDTAAVCTALGAMLGLAAGRPDRPEGYRRSLIIVAAFSEVVAVWLIMNLNNVNLLEAYTLPFAFFALLVGLMERRYRRDFGSWLTYGPALVAGFLPTLVIGLTSDSTPTRRVLLISVAVLTLAVGSVRRQKAPVAIGSVVTIVATVHELILLGRTLNSWVLLVLFTVAGALLIGLGATYEKRRRDLVRLRGAFGRMT